MIEQILDKVKNNIGDQLVEKTGMNAEQVPQALQSISSSVMRKAKEQLESGNIMELKDMFTSGDEAQKQAFFSEMKTEVSSGLQNDLNLSPTQAATVVETSIPEFINVAKEEILGPDGKFSLTDIPRLMSFIKSEGKDASGSGGLGSLFGF